MAGFSKNFSHASQAGRSCQADHTGTWAFKITRSPHFPLEEFCEREGPRPLRRATSSVRDLGHFTGHTRALQLSLKTPANFGIFVLVIDQGPAVFYRDNDAIVLALGGGVESRRIDSAAKPNGEVPGRTRAGIEVLMKPPTRRAVNTAFFPRHLHNPVPMPFFVGPQSQLFGPEQDIPGRLQSHQNRPWPMIMGLMI